MSYYFLLDLFFYSFSSTKYGRSDFTYFLCTQFFGSLKQAQFFAQFLLFSSFLHLSMFIQTESHVEKARKL